MTDKDTDEFVRELGIQLLKKKQMNGLKSLSKEEKIFICIYLFDYELYQGGADQFFFNSSGNYANELISALEEIGASNSVELYKSAIALFPSGHVPHEIGERRKLLRQLSADGQYYQVIDNLTHNYCKDPDQTTQRLYEYVQSRKICFSFIPASKTSL